MANIRFFLDENLQVAIGAQLNRRGIPAFTVRDLGLLGQADRRHLALAIERGYVLCTNDSDFVDLAQSGMAHTGIVFGQQHLHGVGTWVKFLELVYEVYSAEEMVNRIEYVKT